MLHVVTYLGVGSKVARSYERKQPITRDLGRKKEAKTV